MTQKSFGRRSSLAGAALLTGALVMVFAAGCDQSDSSPLAAGVVGARGAESSAIPAITLSDLPAEMKLTDSQAAQMAAALQTLGERRRGAHDRFQRGERWGRAEEPPMIPFLERSSEVLTPDQFQVLARYLAARRTAMRAESRGWAQSLGHAGMRGFGARMGLGLDETQRAALEEIVRIHAEQVHEVMDGLEDGSVSPEEARTRIHLIREEGRTQARALLGEEKMAKVEAFRRDRIRDRVSDRTDQLGDRLDRRAGFIARALGLAAAQTEQVEAILEGTVPARQEVHRNLKDGHLEPEDAALEIARIEMEAADRIRALLSPEQAERWDDLRDLLPRGFQRFGGGH